MSIPKIEMVPTSKVVINPYRNLGTYPVLKHKVEALKASFRTVGIWPSIIARPAPRGQVQQAFGHQRMEAARQLGIKEVPVIVMELSDEQMVQYMGRENGEDYAAEFLVMLNTWEAGQSFLFRRTEKKPEAVEVARLLGWMRVSHRRTGDHEVMTEVANACSGAARLIEAGHNSRDDFEGISVGAAEDIVSRALSHMATIEHTGKAAGASAKDIEASKKLVGHGVRETTREVRSGQLAPKKAAGQVGVNTLKAAGKEKAKPEVLFAAFGDQLAATINKMLQYDHTAEKLTEIVKVLEYVIEARDKAILRSLDFELGELATRCAEWQVRLTTGKVRPFPATAQIGGPNG